MCVLCPGAHSQLPVLVKGLFSPAHKLSLSGPLPFSLKLSLNSFHDFTRFLISNKYLYSDDEFDWVGRDHVLLPTCCSMYTSVHVAHTIRWQASPPYHNINFTVTLHWRFIQMAIYECILSGQIRSGHGQVISLAVHACI